MSDTYNYEEGANHFDHKRVLHLHIEKLQGADLQQVMSRLFKDEAGEADYEEVEASSTVEEPENAQVEPLNLFAPKKNLQELLKGAWFAEVRTDGKYDAQWTDAFVEALMQSEHGEGIARQWAVGGERNKRTQIKGYVVGLLKDAGVLRGSYDAIARKIGITLEPRTFSSYMGDGKRQPYEAWVQAYVNRIIS